MKLPSILSSGATLRGLLAATLLATATASAATVKDSYNINASAINGTYGAPNVGWPFVAPTGYILTGVQTKFLSTDGRTVTVEVWDGVPSLGGTLQRTASFVPTSNTLGGPSFASLALTSGHTYFVGFKNVANVITANVTPDAGAQFVSDIYYDNGSGAYDQTLSHAQNALVCQPILAFLGKGNSVVYQKGDAVPGVAGGVTFSSLGVPAINDAGQIAFYGKWSGGAGVFVDATPVALVGSDVSGGAGVLLKSAKDPVINAAGQVAFAASFAGAGIGSATYTGVVSNAPGGTIGIVAQQGYQATDAPAGALWKSFTSTAVQSGGGGVIFLATMAGGTITAATDTGVWAADAAGALHLVLQEGVTVIGGKTVKNFAALKSVSKSPGQTHAFNSAAELVAKVTFTDGYTAVVQIDLP